jgi:hypothetical protein
MKILSHLFIVFFFSLSAFADCASVDLEEKGGSLFEVSRTVYDAYRLKNERSLKANALSVASYSITLKNPTRQQSLLIKNINSEFDVYGNQTLPLEIGFCSTVLYKGPQFVFKDKSTVEKLNIDCDAQSVLISARRKNPAHGKCEFKIRNSWGHCGKVKPTFECNIKNGDTWISEEILERYILGISILK